MRPGPWATSSELERAMECPASAVLPREVDSPGEGALWGTSIHHWKHTGIAPAGLLDHGRGKKYRSRLEVLSEAGLSRETLWPGGHHEVTYVYGFSPDYPEAVQRGALENVKSLPPTATKGTLDWESTDTGLLWVDDLKTGKLEYDEPDQRPQMLFYGMCAAMWRSLPPSEDVILSITRWPRYPRETPPTRSSQLVPVSRLLTFKRDLDEARERALTPGSHDITRVGPWCTYCKSRNYCPEYR